jgi:SAM-dependent methyltransferase
MDKQERSRKKLEHKIYWDVVSERPGSVLGLVGKMIREPAYFISVVRKHLHLGKPKPFPELTTDRIVLEQQIFKHYREADEFKRILFVGCDADTARYQELYFPDRRFITLEPNPSNRAFGAPEHIVGSMEDMGSHIAKESLDLILCNGVFGWGLDEKQNCERAFAAAHEALRPGGQLLIGWNDVPRRAPFALESIESLSRFRRYTFPLFGTCRYLTDTVYRHTFDFYQR